MEVMRDTQSRESVKGRRTCSAVRVKGSNKEDPYRRCSTRIDCELCHETGSEHVGENDKEAGRDSQIIPIPKARHLGLMRKRLRRVSLCYYLWRPEESDEALKAGAISSLGVGLQGPGYSAFRSISLSEPVQRWATRSADEHELPHSLEGA